MVIIVFDFTYYIKLILETRLCSLISLFGIYNLDQTLYFKRPEYILNIIVLMIAYLLISYA
jgi:hypothetical protein